MENKTNFLCERDYIELLQQFTECAKEVLGTNLVGVYLHGSMAMGCFNPKKSDLDLILVVENSLTDDIKIDFMEKLIPFDEKAPEKGMELSIVKREFCKPFLYPTPYELHYSRAHLALWKENPQEYVRRLQGTDKDLAAHFTIINRYGKVLYGEEIPAVFGQVPKDDYMDSIWYDVENAAEDILTDPVYITLNLCRVLAYLKEDLVLSKKAGGEWGVSTLPEKYRDFVRQALRCYES